MGTDKKGPVFDPSIFGFLGAKEQAAHLEEERQQKEKLVGLAEHAIEAAAEWKTRYNDAMQALRLADAENEKLRGHVALAKEGARFFHQLMAKAYHLLVKTLTEKGLSKAELEKHPLLAEMRNFVQPVSKENAS
jgi:hypothetical protein